MSPLSGTVERGSPTASAPQQRSARRMPSLCKQGVRGSSPLGSTPSESTFAACLAAVLFGPYSRKYSNSDYLLIL